MRKDIIVYYYADPDKLTEDHKGNFFSCTEFTERSFPNVPKAMTFLMECTRPYTTIDTLVENNHPIKDAINVLKHKRLGYEAYDDVFDNLMN